MLQTVCDRCENVIDGNESVDLGVNYRTDSEKIKPPPGKSYDYCAICFPAVVRELGAVFGKGRGRKIPK